MVLIHKKKLNKHNEIKCYTNEPARLIYPKTKDAFIKFKNFKKKRFRYPYVIYADFECILEDYDNLLCDENTMSGAYKKHTPCGYAYNVVDIYSKLNLKTNVTPLIISENEKLQYKNTLKCHICGDFFNENDEKLKKSM